MTAFDLFQRATCEIMDGKREDAYRTLDSAVSAIDRNGIDANMRGDLVKLRDALKPTP